MINRNLKYNLIAIVLLFFSNLNFGQEINFGTASSFVLFTGAGAINNTGNSTFKGDVGTHVGAAAIFNSNDMEGEVYIGNATTAQALTDLELAYNELMAVPATETGHTPTFANETLEAGVYTIAGAGSVGGTIYLDAQGDTSARFIFRFGGAFTTVAGSTIQLINGALPSNVYWVAYGAIAVAAVSDITGTFISHPGAVSMEASSKLTGRLFSSVGAVSISTDSEVNNFIPCATCDPFALSIDLVSFTSQCFCQSSAFQWETASEKNNDYFSIERSIDGINWKNIARVEGSGNSSSEEYYLYLYKGPQSDLSYYKLKQTDNNGQFTYSDIISQENCLRKKIELYISPNPVKEVIYIKYKGNKKKVLSVSIHNLFGEIIYYSASYQSSINLKNKENGIYFVELNLGSRKIIKKFMIQNND
jgi:hypothetical protein